MLGHDWKCTGYRAGYNLTLLFLPSGKTLPASPCAAVRLEYVSRTEATHKEIATEEGQATWETEATAGTSCLSKGAEVLVSDGPYVANAVDGKVTLYTT